jgi:nucleoporin GLE1
MYTDIWQVRDLLDVFEKGKSVDETVLIWLLNFFSKQVIVPTPCSTPTNPQKQAESEVVVQIPSAYPLAYVCVFLMSRYASLRAILLARFAKNCPWTVPFYDEPKVPSPTPTLSLTSRPKYP